MVANELGKIIEEEWYKTGAVRKNVRLDEFVLMPNHIHGILFLMDNGSSAENPAAGARRNGVARGSLGAIMAQFKSLVTKRSQGLAAPYDLPIWQRGYYARQIGVAAELNRIRAYIVANPSRWEDDEHFVHPQSQTTVRR